MENSRARSEAGKVNDMVGRVVVFVVKITKRKNQGD